MELIQLSFLRAHVSIISYLWTLTYKINYIQKEVASVRNVKKYVKAHKKLKARNGLNKFHVTVLKGDKVLLQVAFHKAEHVQSFQKGCIKRGLKVIVRKG